MDDADGWQPIEIAPPETTILMRAIRGDQEFFGRGRISKPQHGKRIEYQWHYTQVAPTHWKPL